jgi:hypothetical protein
MLTHFLAETASGSPTPILLKDWVVPLVGPAVSVIVALLFIWLVPRRQKKRDLVIDLWKTYNTDEMQKARREAWRFTNGVASNPTSTQWVEPFWDWSLIIGTQKHGPDEAEKFHQLQMVFDFFATCDQCLLLGEVDERLLKATLGYYFSRWAHILETHVRQNPPDRSLRESARRPAWLDGMPEFRKLMGMTPPRELN